MGQYGREEVHKRRSSVGGAGVEVPRVVMAAVPLLLLVVKFGTCPGSMGDKVPAAAKQGAGQLSMGCVAPCRPDALLVVQR